ncbi:hypothetical protein OV203_26095 [Nannocystis sp. ILAH1]|uniref:hypothetical protein n=1 Tax=Nannocystis sp. ILAH1 TaxID=2996789 RepID=UPI0022707327|nr:hypothetical protein [Nannocystis sp. ILAH1]MCY0990642.1 hypothetical protein [Nannocystis sp. ILAH1]
MSHNSKNLAESREITAANLLDLTKSAVRYHRRLVWACGLDSDDAVQLIAMKALERMQGQHPYDSARATAQVWVRLLTSSVCLNMLDKQRRRAQHPPPTPSLVSWTDTSKLFYPEPEPKPEEEVDEPGSDLLDHPEVDIVTFLRGAPPRVEITKEVAWEAVQR